MKSQTGNSAARPRFDLEARTLRFTKQVIELVNGLPRTTPNFEVGKQPVRSAGSVGANYIEANEALSKKDFLLRIKTARKEAKESRYWLELVECSEEQSAIRSKLIQEATELLKILSAIVAKSS